MNCRYCGKPCDGVTIYHPTLKPSIQFYKDMCSDCANTILSVEDWSIQSVLKKEASDVK